jgi:hypothetical protein
MCWAMSAIDVPADSAGSVLADGPHRNEQDCIRRLSRARAIWKLADRSLLARHYRPEHLLTVADTDTMMRRDTILTNRELAAVTEESDAD